MPVAFRKAGSPDDECHRAEAGPQKFSKKIICGQVPPRPLFCYTCEMKVIKFRHYLVPLVLSGEKDITWRLFDDKDLSVGDDIELQIFAKNEPFAYGKIVKVIEKPFKKLSFEDKAGHEKFNSDQEMYATYSKYYKTEVGPETLVKIIWFKLKK